MKFEDRIVELIRVRASELTDNTSNWRRHPKRQREAFRDLLGEIGWAVAIVAYRKPDGTIVIIDGHLRKEEAGNALVPVLITDFTDEEADKLLAVLDPLAAMARPDAAALDALLLKVSTSSESIADLLENLRRSAGLPFVGLADPEELPERVPQRARLGDTWLLGESRLRCGDARLPSEIEALIRGELIDLLVTDPPWGVGYQGKTALALRIANDGAAEQTDLLARSFAACNIALAEGARIYVFSPSGAGSVAFANAFLAAGWTLRQTLVWCKDRPVLGHGDYHYRHEPILYGVTPGVRRGRGYAGWYGGDDQNSVIEVPRPAASHEHPTAKPVELMRRLIANSTRRGQSVLDPFAGSGSVLIASEMLGRRCFALEIDPAYCDVIIARFERNTGQVAQLEKVSA